MATMNFKKLILESKESFKGMKKETVEATEQEKKEGYIDNDPVNHPKHYTSHPSGVECIEITEHMNFCLGNAMKYIWRAFEKGDLYKTKEDLRKAVWYINREIERLSTGTREVD